MRRLTKIDESGESVEEWKTFSEKSFLERDSHIGDTGVARVQKWTLAHAYYVNMGGIVARKVMHDPSQNTKEPIVNSYSVLRFDDLTDSRWTETGLGHPLKALRLSAQDIMDKSKADWIVKIIAVVQIARLIFDLATRALLDQPVTQLEIATASFAVFAMVTYWANWWKPKDIAEPTRLHAIVHQGMREDEIKRSTEPFFKRLWVPTPPVRRYENTMDPGNRIQNDELWIGKGSSALAWLLMALSCFVFGGIHCIAWSFEFPTRTELIAWRTAAMVSTFFPVVALAGSFLIMIHRPHGLNGALKVAAEEIMDAYGDALLRVNDDWWEKFTTGVKSEEWKEWIVEHSRGSTSRNMIMEWELVKLQQLRSRLKKIRDTCNTEENLSRKMTRDLEKAINSVWDIARSSIPSRTDPSGHLLSRRRSYQDWVKEKHAHLDGSLGGLPYGGPEGVFHWIFSRCCPQTTDLGPSEAEKAYRTLRESYDIRAKRLSRFINAINAIFYTTARLVLLAIMISSLRQTPNGVYDTPNWTRFVPSFS